MSALRPNLVYIGDYERGRALERVVEPDGATVYLPKNTREALAMVVFYCPDAVILDFAANPAVAAECAFHLRAMTGDAPLLVALACAPAGAATSDGMLSLPANADHALLLGVVRAVLAGPGTPARLLTAE